MRNNTRFTWVFCLLISISILLPTTQPGGTNLNSIPVQYDFHTFLTNNVSVSIPGEEVNIEAYANTYAHLTAKFDTRVTSLGAGIIVRSGNIGSLWGPGIGISWDADNSLTFVMADVSETEQSIILNYILDGEKGQMMDITSFSYDDPILLSVSVSEFGIINVDYNVHGISEDFINDATTTIGNNINTYNLVDSGVNLYSSTIMYGKGLMSNFAEDDLVGDGVFETISSVDLGSVGEIDFNNLYVSMVDSTDTFSTTQIITHNTTESTTVDITSTVMEYVDTTTVDVGTIDGFPLSLTLLAIPVVMLFRRRKMN